MAIKIADLSHSRFARWLCKTIVLMFIISLFIGIKAYSKNVTRIDIKKFSFKECLYYKYSDFRYPDADNQDTFNQKDPSYNWVANEIMNKSPEKLKALKNYIRKSYEYKKYFPKSPIKETYYKKYEVFSISMKNEYFYDCMRFYKSKLLDDYIDNNVLGD